MWSSGCTISNPEMAPDREGLGSPRKHGSALLVLLPSGFDISKPPQPLGSRLRGNDEWVCGNDEKYQHGLVEEAVVDVVGYCGGDELRPLDGDIVDAVFHPDGLALGEQRLSPSYGFLAPEPARLG